MPATPVPSGFATPRPAAVTPAVSRRVFAELRTRKMALLGIVVLLAIVLVAIFAPLIAPHDPLKQNLGDLKVFKVGEVNVDVYIVGKTGSGKWAGVRTAAVET